VVSFFGGGWWLVVVLYCFASSGRVLTIGVPGTDVITCSPPPGLVGGGWGIGGGGLWGV